MEYRGWKRKPQRQPTEAFDFFLNHAKHTTASHVLSKTCPGWQGVTRVNTDMPYRFAANMSKPSNYGGRGLSWKEKWYVARLYGNTANRESVYVEIPAPKKVVLELPETHGTRDDAIKYVLGVEKGLGMKAGTLCTKEAVDSFQMKFRSSGFIPEDPEVADTPKKFPCITLSFVGPKIEREVIEYITENHVVCKDNYPIKATIHETSVDPITRFLIESKVQPSTWVTIPEPRPFKAKGISTCDVECVADRVIKADVKLPPVPMKELYFDFEVTAYNGEEFDAYLEEKRKNPGLRPRFPKPDIESNKIVQASLVFEQGKDREVFLLELREEDTDEPEVIEDEFRGIKYTTIFYETEKALCNAFRDIIVFKDPDVISAYNSQFDLRYIFARGKHDYRFNSMGRLLEDRMDQVWMRSCGKRMPVKEACAIEGTEVPFEFEGRIIYDLYTMVKDGKFGNFPSRKLNYFSQIWLGDSKVSFEAEDIFAAWTGRMTNHRFNTITSEDPDYHEEAVGPPSASPMLSAQRKALRRYCMYDSALVGMITHRRKILIQYAEVAVVTYCPLDECLNKKKLRVLLGKVAEVAWREGAVVNVLDMDLPPKGSKYDGAWVGDAIRGYYGGVKDDTDAAPLLPQPEIPPQVDTSFLTAEEKQQYPHDKTVAVLDFASLYPSTMLARNFCTSTLVTEKRRLYPSEQSAIGYTIFKGGVPPAPPLPPPEISDKDMIKHGSGIWADAPDADRYNTCIIVSTKGLPPCRHRFAKKFLSVFSIALREFLGNRKIQKKYKSAYGMAFKAIKKEVAGLPDGDDVEFVREVTDLVPLGDLVRKNFDEGKALAIGWLKEQMEAYENRVAPAACMLMERGVPQTVLRKVFSETLYVWPHKAFLASLETDWDLADAKQLAFKLLGNSLYGISGYTGRVTPVSARALAASICAAAKQMTLDSKAYIEKHHSDIVSDVIYGDTDSVFPCFRLPLRETKPIAEQIADEMTNGELFGWCDDIVLEFESLEENILLYGPKMYASRSYEEGGPKYKMKIKGLSIKRNDYPEVANIIMKQAVDIMLHCGGFKIGVIKKMLVRALANHLEKVLRSPDEGGHPLDVYVIRKGLNTVNPAGAPSEQLRVARKIQERTGRPVEERTIISYVIYKGDVENAEDAEWRKIDRELYITKRIRNILTKTMMWAVEEEIIDAVFELYLAELSRMESPMNRFSAYRIMTSKERFDKAMGYLDNPPPAHTAQGRKRKIVGDTVEQRKPKTRNISDFFGKLKK